VNILSIGVKVCPQPSTKDRIKNLAQTRKLKKEANQIFGEKKEEDQQLGRRRNKKRSR